MKFKVGQRVKTKFPAAPYIDGRLGTVVGLIDYKYLTVRVNDLAAVLKFEENELLPIELPYIKILKETVYER